jgi:uncharacterized protein (TIGR02145 family)
MKSLIRLNVIILLSIISFGCTDDDANTIEDPILTLTDADGNVYNTITIGDQVWMLENLKTTSYNDGAPINEYTFGNDWHNGNTQIDYYQWADTFDLNNQFDEELPFDYYGAMYNHFAIESGKLAPEGWRIPTVEDYMELESYLANNGQSGTEGEALKTTTGWLDIAGNGTDAIGFKGLPNGYIHAFGGPTLGGGICTWATNQVDVQNGTRTIINLFNEPTLMYANNAIQIGAGIRCIKD